MYATCGFKLFRWSKPFMDFQVLVALALSFVGGLSTSLAGSMKKSEWSTYVTSKRLVADAFVFLRYMFLFFPVNDPPILTLKFQHAYYLHYKVCIYYPASLYVQNFKLAKVHLKLVYGNAGTYIYFIYIGVFDELYLLYLV